MPLTLQPAAVGDPWRRTAVAVLVDYLGGGADRRARKLHHSCAVLCCMWSLGGPVLLTVLLVSGAAELQQSSSPYVIPHLVKEEVHEDGPDRLQDLVAREWHLPDGGASIEAAERNRERLKAEAEAAKSPHPSIQLKRAAHDGDVERVRELLASKPYLAVDDFRDTDESALMAASMSGWNDVVELLLEHGADHSRANARGNTPLMWASKEGRTSTVEILLEAGALLNHQNMAGSTALMEATKHGHGHGGVAITLLMRGSFIDTQDVSGMTALMHATAVNFTHMVELL